MSKYIFHTDGEMNDDREAADMTVKGLMSHQPTKIEKIQTGLSTALSFIASKLHPSYQSKEKEPYHIYRDVLSTKNLKGNSDAVAGNETRLNEFKTWLLGQVLIIHCSCRDFAV